MIRFLTKLFIPRAQETSDPEVRRAYGVLCGSVGIFLNIVLFTGKFLAGTISRSIAITADAFNNLSDAGSSLITLVGFKMAGQKPDPEHPFGHGRIEYLSGFVVSMAILMMAAELIKSSVGKIVHPEETSVTPLIFVILLCSIAVKLYMCYYNRSVSKRIDSAAMAATAIDSLSDSLATTVVLLSSLFTKLTGILIDGYCGVAVGLFILYAGLSAAKETISPLLGQPPEPEFVEKIRKLVMEHDEVLGIHDLIVHNYGPGRIMISLHAEVPASGDILALHDTIDCIEQQLQKELKCQAVIHMDPILTDDQETSEYKSLVLKIVKGIDSVLTIHDFRIVKGTTHTNLIFDLVTPFDYSIGDKELCSQIYQEVQREQPNLYTVIQVDKDYNL
ncbi:MAG: cation transporter [Lachnospiraceae bacterium]|nr:cation transporter [Lachnospiraceae bacterium]